MSSPWPGFCKRLSEKWSCDYPEEHSLGHRQIDERLGVIDAHLVVADQTPGLDQPTESSFHDPALGQNLEAFRNVAALDDLQINLAVTGKIRDFSFQLSGIASVGPNPLQPAVAVAQCGKQQSCPVTILNVCGGDLQVKDEAERIYQNVSLSSCNFLTRIKATKSGLVSCANALAVEDRSSRGFFLPCLRRARSRIA